MRWEYLVDEPIGSGNLSKRGAQGWELVSRYGAIGDSWVFKRPKTKTPEEHARAALSIQEIPARRAYLDDINPEERAKVKHEMMVLRAAGASKTEGLVLRNITNWLQSQIDHNPYGMPARVLMSFKVWKTVLGHFDKGPDFLPEDRQRWKEALEATITAMERRDAIQARRGQHHPSLG